LRVLNPEIRSKMILEDHGKLQNFDEKASRTCTRSGMFCCESGTSSRPRKKREDEREARAEHREQEFAGKRDELHDNKHQPDIPEGVGAKIGMPLAEFTDEAWEGLERGDEQVAVGELCQNNANTWEKERQAAFLKMYEQMSKRS